MATTGLINRAARLTARANTANTAAGLPTITPTTVQNPTGLPSATSLTSNGGITGTGTYDPSLITDTAKWNVTPEQTTQGQLDTLLSKNNPIMRQAATSGLQLKNDRGLLNSGQAIQSAESAVIGAAVPIAQSDADVYSRSAGYNADTLNKVAVNNQTANNQASQFGAGSKLTQSENELARQQQTALQNNQQAWQGGQNETDRALQVKQDTFNANVQAALADINNQAQGDRNQQQIYGNLSQETMRQIAAINTDVNMDQQSKDYAINQLMGTYKANLSIISAVGSVPDVSTLLDFKQPTPTYSSADINKWLSEHAGASDKQIAQAMNDYGITAQQMSAATGTPVAQIQQRYQAAMGTPL